MIKHRGRDLLSPRLLANPNVGIGFTGVDIITLQVGRLRHQRGTYLSTDTHVMECKAEEPTHVFPGPALGFLHQPPMPPWFCVCTGAEYTAAFTPQGPHSLKVPT